MLVTLRRVSVSFAGGSSVLWMVGLATALLLIEMCIVSPLPRVLSVSCMLRVGQPMPVKYILHKPAMTHGHRTVICRLHNGKALRFKSEDWKTSSSNVGTSPGAEGAWRDCRR